MRIPCPFCGERDLSEFEFLGDAALQRPDPTAPEALERFVDYVYLRDNPQGIHSELCQHRYGCRSWLVVERDTGTHDIASVRLAADRSACVSAEVA